MWVAGSVIMVLVGLWSVVAAMVAEERRQQAREAHSTRLNGALVARATHEMRPRRS